MADEIKENRFKDLNFLSFNTANKIKDEIILEKSFRMKGAGIPTEKRNEELHQQKLRASYFNVFSTAAGDNIYINQYHQYSPATDHRPPRIMSDSQNKTGTMGWGYENTIDKYSTQITIDPSVIEFTGLLSFLNHAFDPISILTAHQGKTPGFWFYLGQVTGLISFWPFQLIQMSLASIDWLMNTPPNQFFYCRSAMGAYLSSCQNFFNDICVYAGYTNPLCGPKKGVKLPEDTAWLEKAGSISSFRQDYADNYDEPRLKSLNAEFPGSINEDGTINLTIMVNKGIVKYMTMVQEVEKAMKAGFLITHPGSSAAISVDQKFNRLVQTFEGYRKYNTLKGTLENIDYNQYSLYNLTELEQAQYGELNVGSASPTSSDSTTIISRGDNFGRLNGAFKSISTIKEEVDDQTDYSTGINTSYSGDGGTPVYDEDATISQIWYGGTLTEDQGYIDTLTNLWTAKMYGGYDGLNFKVEHQGSVTDSFSNSTSKSAIAEKFNSAAKGAADVKFDLAGGVSGIKIIDGIVGAAKEAIAGISNSIGITNIAWAALNSGYVRIPDHWADSTCELHQESYKIELIAPYAHPYCMMTSIYAPLSLILPMCLPNSAGSSAYTTPFYVKCFSKGRTNIRNGIIGSCSVEFGSGGIGFTMDRKPLRCTITFNVVNLDPFLTLPLNRFNGVLEALNPAAALKKVMFDNGAYNSYLGRLTGLSYLETQLRGNRIRNNWESMKASIKHSISPTAFANAVNDSLISDIYYGLNGHPFNR